MWCSTCFARRSLHSSVEATHGNEDVRRWMCAAKLLPSLDLKHTFPPMPGQTGLTTPENGA
jgi:hypothetical protein